MGLSLGAPRHQCRPHFCSVGLARARESERLTAVSRHWSLWGHCFRDAHSHEQEPIGESTSIWNVQTSHPERFSPGRPSALGAGIVWIRSFPGPGDCAYWARWLLFYLWSWVRALVRVCCLKMRWFSWGSVFSLARTGQCYVCRAATPFPSGISRSEKRKQVMKGR